MNYTTYKVTVPSNIKGKVDKDKQAEMLELVISTLSDSFGGATAIPAKGGYKDNSGAIILEDVFEVVTYAKEANHSLLDKLANKIKDFMEQESVMYIIDNQPYFI